VLNSQWEPAAAAAICSYVFISVIYAAQAERFWEEYLMYRFGFMALFWFNRVIWQVTIALCKRWGRAIAQAVSRWLPTASARVRARVWSCGIWGGHGEVGQVFSEYFGFPCQSSFHQFLHNHHHLSSGAGNGPVVAAVPSGLSLIPLIIILKRNMYALPGLCSRPLVNDLVCNCLSNCMNKILNSLWIIHSYITTAKNQRAMCCGVKIWITVQNWSSFKLS
jgi:hypothetical protein